MDLQIRSILNIICILLLQIIVLFLKRNWFRFSEIKQVSQKCVWGFVVVFFLSFSI